MGRCGANEECTIVTFMPDDKVTVLMNLQCHGVVLESTEESTDVKLDNFPLSMQFRTAELKLRETKDEQQPQG